MVGGENYTFFFPVQKCVEQLHNYTIVNGLFFLMCKMSKYLCYKKLLLFWYLSGYEIEMRNKLSVGLRSSITARRAKLLLVSFNAVYDFFFSVFCTNILCQKTEFS